MKMSSLAEFVDHQIGQGQGCGQSRRFDAEEIDQALQPMLRWALHQEIRRRAVGTMELRPYAGISGQQRAVGKAWPITPRSLLP